MRLLITTHGGSHFHPLAPIADAAGARGHEVCFATEAPNDANIAAAGFDVRPVGMRFDFRVPEQTFPELRQQHGLDEAIWTMEHIFFGALARAALDDIEVLVDEWRPDVVLHEMSEVAGSLVAERRSLPFATFNYGGMDLGLLQFIAGAPWNALRTHLGLAPDPDMSAIAGGLVLAALPQRWAGETPPAGVLRVRLPLFAGATGGAPVAAAIPDRIGDRYIFATLGTTGRGDALLSAVVAALGMTGRPALVTTGGGALDETDLPPCVHHAGDVANVALLPGATAVLHHGGFNTLLGALRFGLPQVIVPVHAEQPINAARASELGFAISLDEGARSPEEIAAAIERVHREPSFGEAAQQFRREIDDLPPVEAAVDALESMLR